MARAFRDAGFDNLVRRTRGGLKRHCPRNQLINSGNSRTSNCGSSASPAPPAANLYTNAQKPLCEEHVPCFLGTTYLRKAANFIGSAPNVLTRATGHCAHCAISGATERFVNAARIGLVAAQNPEARVRHAESERRHALARSSWDASSQPAWLTSEFFSQQVHPLLAKFSTSTICRRIGVSRWYASRVRQGYKPHPRHWRALSELVGKRADDQIPQTNAPA